MAEQGSAAEDERERLRIELRDVRLKRTAGEFWQAVDRLIDFEIRRAVEVGRAEMNAPSTPDEGGDERP